MDDLVFDTSALCFLWMSEEYKGDEMVVMEALKSRLSHLLLYVLPNTVLKSLVKIQTEGFRSETAGGFSLSC